MTLESKTKKVPHIARESSIQDLQERVDRLQSQVERLQQALASMETKVHTTAGRYVAVCPACRTPFDMLAHHYSIGLFDNLVYVKCPKCQKSLPLKGGSGGEIRLVTD